MPLYMDRHDGLDATAKSVAEAHLLDLKVQKQFNCKALTYWFDEGKHIAFCLIEAPEKKAVEEMHRNSHGLIPNQIIEVQSDVVEYFLGRISDPESVKKSKEFIHETAFRAILHIDCKRILTALRQADNKEPGMSTILNKIIRPAIKEYNGTEVKIKSEGLMASFTSVSKSLSCALKIQKGIREANRKSKGYKIIASMGLSTGYPISDREDFFGETVLLARRLSDIATDNKIVLSNDYKNEYEHKGTKSEKNFVRITNPSEEKFLNSLMELTEKVWNDENFNVVDFGRKLGLSKAQLYRKITSLTGYSPNEFIKSYRLNKALKLLENKHGNISEIAFETGFNTPSYFSKCFQKKFGIPPSDYANAIA
jgi:AraC-like DNA-binding protein